MKYVIRHYVIRKGVLAAIATAGMLVPLSAYAGPTSTFYTATVWSSGEVDASNLPTSGCYVSSDWWAFPWGTTIGVCDNVGLEGPCNLNGGWSSSGMKYYGVAVVECNDNNVYGVNIDTSTQYATGSCPFGLVPKIWAGLMEADTNPNDPCAE